MADIQNTIDILKKDFQSLFGELPIEEILVVPGVELFLGNFVKQNGGKIIMSSTSEENVIIASRSAKSIVSFSVNNSNLSEMDISDLNGRQNEFLTVNGLIRGMLAKILITKGAILPGLSLLIKVAKSEINESLCYALIEIINDLYFSGQLTFDEEKEIAKYSMENYVGLPFDSQKFAMIDKKGMYILDYKNPREIEYTKIDLDFSSYTFFHIATDARYRNNAFSLGDVVEKEMSETARLLKKERLGEIDVCDWMQLPSILNGNFPYSRVLQAQHYFDELIRVNQVIEALKNNASPVTLLTSMKLSTFSSSSYLHLLENGMFLKPAIDFINGVLVSSSAYLNGDGTKGYITACISLSEVDKASEYLNSNYPNLILPFSINTTGIIKISYSSVDEKEEECSSKTIPQTSEMVEDSTEIIVPSSSPNMNNSEPDNYSVVSPIKNKKSIFDEDDD